MTAVKIGIYLPQVDLSFDEVLARAERVEALGFHSFWLFDHLYTPGLPDKAALESWTLATALLARTSTLRVGHLVLNNNFRHPALLAKMVATADVMSGGRLELGLGSGSVELEHAQAGFEFGTMPDRSARLGEALSIVIELLTNGRSSFQGHHYRLEDVPCLPLPVQRPHPPVHIGGVSERYTIPLVARFADVWNVPTYGLADWRTKREALDQACEEVGRDPATITRSHQAVLVLGRDDGALDEVRASAQRRYAGPGWGLDAGGYVGTPSAIVDHLGRMAEQGITQYVLLPSDRGRGDMLELLAEQVLPQLP